MSGGRSHDRFNILIGAVFTGSLIAFKFELIVIFSFIFGWFVSTLIFSPDTDLMPKKRSGVLQFALYPYAILFKHRGISHSLWFGTLTRVFYTITIFGAFTFVMSKMGYLSFTLNDYWNNLVSFISSYDYGKDVYKSITWIYLGMFVADACHVLLDILSTLWRKILRFIFS